MSRRSWPVPLALVGLSAIPLTAGAMRLLQLAGGPELMPADRLVFASTMAGCLVLGVGAVRRRDVAAHRAWMIRAYAIGLGAGWVINLVVAEWAIRRPALPRRAVRVAS